MGAAFVEIGSAPSHCAASCFCHPGGRSREGLAFVCPGAQYAWTTRNGPRWTSMTSPTSGGQSRRVNFSLPLLRAFSVDWRPRWRRGRGHDDTRARPYPDPRAKRADGRRPDRRDRKSPPTSPPLAPLLHPRRARKEDGPRRHRPSRTANRHAPEAQRSPRPKGSAQSAGSADRATQQSEVASTVLAGVAVTTDLGQTGGENGGPKISFASHSEAAGVGACPASVAVCAVLAAGGIIVKPRIKDVASLAFAGASVASAFLAAAFSPAECASKKMPVPAAAAATTTDARQRREVNRSRRPPARLDLS